ncbi:hypothetical protein Tco_0725632 [Tanacetum coccineum]|uniref:Uncharacterized protein n=1 Tax=Tanacetum coccineum TaxID=301880 RepID=A0ABQ4YFL4_9ASTR
MDSRLASHLSKGIGRGPKLGCKSEQYWKFPVFLILLKVLAAYKHFKPFLSHQGFKISSLVLPLSAAYQEKNNTSKLASSLNKSSYSLS